MCDTFNYFASVLQILYLRYVFGRLLWYSSYKNLYNTAKSYTILQQIAKYFGGHILQQRWTRLFLRSCENLFYPIKGCLNLERCVTDPNYTTAGPRKQTEEVSESEF